MIKVEKGLAEGRKKGAKDDVGRDGVTVGGSNEIWPSSTATMGHVWMR